MKQYWEIMYKIKIFISFFFLVFDIVFFLSNTNYNSKEIVLQCFQ